MANICWTAHTKHPVPASVPIHHPTHCRAQSVWPQLSWKANPLILSLQAAGRNRRTISPPTIKNHITEGSGAGPAFHHGRIYRVSGSPRKCNQPDKAQEPSSYQPGPQMPMWHPHQPTEGYTSSRSHQPGPSESRDKASPGYISISYPVPSVPTTCPKFSESLRAP